MAAKKKAKKASKKKGASKKKPHSAQRAKLKREYDAAKREYHRLGKALKNA